MLMVTGGNVIRSGGRQVMQGKGLPQLFLHYMNVALADAQLDAVFVMSDAELWRAHSNGFRAWQQAGFKLPGLQLAG